MVEDELKAVLRGMIGAIDRSEGQDISDSLSTIDGILRARKNELDAQLVHYLSRRSYEKAPLSRRLISWSREFVKIDGQETKSSFGECERI